MLYLLIEFEWLFGLYMGYDIWELEVKYELVNVTQMVEKISRQTRPTLYRNRIGPIRVSSHLHLLFITFGTS